MYFDNFLKNNTNYQNINHQATHVSSYNPHPIQNIDTNPINNKGYFNSKYQQYASDNRVIPVRNYPQIPYQPKNNQLNQGGYATGSTLIPHQIPSNNNNTSFNQDIGNNPLAQQNNEFLKRRDSISFNNMYKQAQTYSPSTKNFPIENNYPSQYSRTTIGNQTGKIPQQNAGIKNQNTNNGLNTSSNNLMKNAQDNTQYNSNKLNKNLSQQKFLHKIGYNKNPNPDTSINTNFIQNKPTTKNNNTFLSENQNLNKYQKQSQSQSQKYRKQTLLSQKNNQNKQKYGNQNNNDFMYNYELKNITLDFNSNKGNSYRENGEFKYRDNNQFKYYTPHLLKEKTEKEQIPSLSRNQYSRISERVQNQRQAILTDRQVYKSPSHNDLFQSVYHQKQPLKNKPSNTQTNNYTNLINKIQTANNNNLNNNKHLSQTFINNNIPSHSGIAQQPQSQKSSNKNYHALIQNLQKKFSQQKKSSQGFQAKQKYYLNQISKKQQKLKRLQNIIENNKQMVQAKDQTIKQLKLKLESQGYIKKQELSNTADSAQLKDLEIEQLKQENGKLKEELKKLKKKIQPLMLNDQNSQKQSSQRQKQLEKRYQKLQTRLKNFQKLQKQCNELKLQKQSYIFQIGKLRQSNSTLHQDYNTEIKQHQRIKQQYLSLKKTKQQLEQALRKNKQSLAEIQIKYNHSKQQINKAQQKYESILANHNSSLHQEYQLKLQRDRKTLKQRFQLQKIQLNQQSKNQIQKIKIKLERYQAELNFKNSRLKDLENKIQSQQKHKQKQSKQSQSNMKIKSQMSEIYIQQLSTLRQKLKKKQQVNQQLAQQLNSKTKVFQRMLFDKGQLENKIEKLQTKVKSLKNINQNHEVQAKQKQRKSFKMQEITFSPQSKCQNQFLKEIQEKHNQIKDILECYHEKYKQIALLFNLSEQQKQKQNNDSQPSSLTSMPHQEVQQQKQSPQSPRIQPSKDYLFTMHPLIKDQIQKVLKDIKKLVLVLKDSQTQIQQKNQKLYQMDKNIKKQGNKINALIAEIHMKNITIIEINKMQIEKDILRLNEKYQILGNVSFNSTIE